MNMTNVCEPVFVVGMNGSGTSMLLDSLGLHPKLYALPDETHMMPYIIQHSDRFGDLNVDDNFREYWQFAIDQMPALQRFNSGVKPDIPTNWQTYPRTVAGVFDGLFSCFAAKQGKRRWCEKTPDHVQHMRGFSAIFPQARFIHIIRDGREVACSINRRQHRNPELIIYRWKKLVEMGRGEGAKLLDKYLEVRYEDMTSDPRREMAKLCRFLEVEFDEQVLLSRMPESPVRKELSRGEIGKISENPLKWPAYFDAKTVRQLEQVGGRMLHNLGYRVQTVAGDRNPSWIQQRIWRANDFLRLVRIRMKTRKNYDSWLKVGRNILVSYKAYRSKRY
jgi:hypothetical protein